MAVENQIIDTGIKITPFPDASFYGDKWSDCDFELILPYKELFDVFIDPSVPMVIISTKTERYVRTFDPDAKDELLTTLEILKEDPSLYRNMGQIIHSEVTGWVEDVLGGRLEDKYQFF